MYHPSTKEVSPAPWRRAVRSAFKIRIRKRTLITSHVIALLAPAWGQTELPSPSPARPFGLDIVGPVYQAGSDEASADFQENALPGLQTFINQRLGERQSLDGVSGFALDPTFLQLQTESDVWVYFVSEGAGYHNSLGFNSQGVGIDEGDPLLIFPDGSSYNVTTQAGDTTLGNRDSNYPLLPGDLADLGTFDAGTSLDFFLIANGVNGGTNVYTSDENLNPDGIQHMVAFALEGSPYLLIGFEDLYGGGDLDFNDMLFAVDIGEANVQAAIALASPEPGTGLVIVAFSLCALVCHRRRLPPKHPRWNPA